MSNDPQYYHCKRGHVRCFRACAVVGPDPRFLRNPVNQLGSNLVVTSHFVGRAPNTYFYLAQFLLVSRAHHLKKSSKNLLPCYPVGVLYAPVLLACTYTHKRRITVTGPFLADLWLTASWNRKIEPPGIVLNP